MFLEDTCVTPFLYCQVFFLVLPAAPILPDKKILNPFSSLCIIKKDDINLNEYLSIDKIRLCFLKAICLIFKIKKFFNKVISLYTKHTLNIYMKL